MEVRTRTDLSGAPPVVTNIAASAVDATIEG